MHPARPHHKPPHAVVAGPHPRTQAWQARGLIVAIFLLATLVGWGVRAPGARAATAWWGVDTTDNVKTANDLALSAASIGTPQFVGRYLIWGGGNSLTADEAQYLHDHSEPILLLDSPASGTLTGAVTATAEAQAAISQAHLLGVSAGTAIFRDVEVNYAIDAGYIAGWYSAFQGSGYFPGLYENPLQGQFPAAYCQAAVQVPAVSTGIALYSNEPESAGADPRRTAAPAWAPSSPACPNTTVAWQYEENGLFPPTLVTPHVDVDQFFPSYAALLWGPTPPAPPAVAQIFGQSADATVAKEFETAYPVVNGAGGNTSAVLATDLQPFDALSASYLEGRLGTGLLITPQASLGTDALGALRLEGVTTVYVVGGPLAVSTTVVAQLQTTPAYLPGGSIRTGANLRVAPAAPGGQPGPIFGPTADDTARAIATYFPSGNGVASFPGAYPVTATSLYNDTTGNSSATATAAAVPTAIVVSDGGFQDAVSAGPVAFATKLPVLITPGNPATTLGVQTASAITSLGIRQVIVIGGPLAVNNAVVSAIQGLNGGIPVLRIAGQDATDSAALLADFELASPSAGLGWNAGTTAFLAANSDADGSDALAWGDLLGAAALGGNANTAFGYEPILQVQGGAVGPYTTTLLHTAAGMAGIQSDTGIQGLNVLGGPLAMTPAVVAALRSALAGA